MKKSAIKKNNSNTKVLPALDGYGHQVSYSPWSRTARSAEEQLQDAGKRDAFKTTQKQQLQSTRIFGPDSRSNKTRQWEERRWLPSSRLP
jgi:hypothetical protein